jgi:hypothetical protein
MRKQNQNSFQFLLLFIVVLISRLPFLSAGYGVEEDSWGMINALRRFHDTGIYEVSRFPGHPVLEFSYFAIWGKSYFVFNFLTALISTVGIVFFAASLKLLGFRKYFWSALAFAFIPVIYIKCTDTMDFMWALSFMMMSLFFILKSRTITDTFNARFYFFAAGISLGLAIGSRFTAGLFIAPLLFLFLDLTRKENWIQFAILSLTTITVALLCFIPVIKIYDPATFVVPYILGRPEFIKSLFKASVGVFGLTGYALLLIVSLKTFLTLRNKRNRINKKYFIKSTPKLQTSKLMGFCYSALIIYVLLFVLEPHKSAYLIAALPFLIILIEFYSNEKYSLVLALGMIVSSFLLGINLEDNYRGTTSSSLSLKLNLASQSISLDLLKGPMLADYERRKQKMSFVNDIILKTRSIVKPTVIIAGWWINDIEVLSAEHKNQNVKYFYFLTEDELKKYQQQGFNIFYLPQQDQVNDLRWQKNFTRNYAKPMYSDDGQKLLF